MNGAHQISHRVPHIFQPLLQLEDGCVQVLTNALWMGMSPLSLFSPAFISTACWDGSLSPLTKKRPHWPTLDFTWVRNTPLLCYVIEILGFCLSSQDCLTLLWLMQYRNPNQVWRFVPASTTTQELPFKSLKIYTNHMCLLWKITK